MLPLAPRLIGCLNAVLACILDGLLIFLIIRKSPKSIDNYKYLMLSFAACGVYYGVLDITNQPFLHFYQGSFIIFSENPLGLPRELSFWYTAINCSCYEMTLSILTFHFIYRYFVLCKPHFLYLFSWPYCNIFIVSSLVFTAGWAIAAVFLIGDSGNTDEYIATTMLQTYGLQKEDFTYVSAVYYRMDPTTLLEYLSITDLIFSIVAASFIVLSFTVIVFCWFHLHRTLLDSDNNHRTLSLKTLEMQRQFFKCLVVQTLIPIIFMFIPAFTIMTLPLFKFEPGPSEGIFLSLISAQPFFDALVPMYSISDYRTTIRRYFRKNLAKSNAVSSTGAHCNSRIE